MEVYQENLKKFCEQMGIERGYQMGKWGEEFDLKNNPNDWVSYITRYTGKCVLLPFDPDEFKKQLVKVATLCAAAWDHCERETLAKRHYDT